MASRADAGGVGVPVAGAAPVADASVVPGPPIDDAALPAAPSVGGAFRRSIQDAYYHSWRLLPANVVWSVAALLLLAAILVTPLAVLLAPLLALPTAGMFRIATRIVRGEAVSFWDAIDAWRRDVRATLVAGAATTAAAVAFFSNVITGLSSASPLGWGLATLAAWGLIALWLLAFALWPILVDPRRAGRPATDRARLAALLVVAHPFRMAALAVVLTLFLAASTVAIVALVTISMSLAALVASRYVLPAADRLEADLARRRTSAIATPIAAASDAPAGASSER